MTRKDICDKARNTRRKYLAESFEKRFWKRVNKNTGTECWHWAAGVGSRGYGEVKRVGVKMVASRAAYEIANGPIPEGMYVCHKCDNPRCVRPDHLFVGTCRDNIRDSVKKGRFGACKLTPKQVEEIRMLSEKYSNKDIAKMFGVAPNTISYIITGRGWKSVTGGANRSRGHVGVFSGVKNPCCKLTENDVLEIRKAYKPIYGSLTKLANKYGMTISGIRRIVHRFNWKHI